MTFPFHPNRIQLRLFSLAIMVAAGLVGGCANWKEKTHSGRALKLPAGAMSHDAIALELGVAQLLPKQQAQMESVWRQLDQQKIPLGLRKILDANGFRVAVVSSQVPAELLQLLSPIEIEVDRLNEFQKQMHEKGLLKPIDPLLVHNRLKNREGKPHLQKISEPLPAMSWLVETPSGTKANAGEAVTGFLEIKAFSKGDGSVRLQLTPQIHHGQPRAQIGVVDRTFLFQHRQSVHVIEDLKFDVLLKPGETLLVGGTPDLGGLAEVFFKVPVGTQLAHPMNAFVSESEIEPLFDEQDEPSTDRKLANETTNTHHQRIALIRLVHTQQDDLFNGRSSGEKLISTPHE